MAIYSTEHFKVFRMRINGVTYYFVGKNKPNGGYMFAYAIKKVAISCCDKLEKALLNGELII